MVAWGTTVIGIGCDLVPSFAGTPNARSIRAHCASKLTLGATPALKTVKRKLFMIAMPVRCILSLKINH